MIPSLRSVPQKLQAFANIHRARRVSKGVPILRYGICERYAAPILLTLPLAQLASPVYNSLHVDGMVSSFTFGIVRKFCLHTSKYHPACRLDDVKNSVVRCVSRRGTLCTELAGFGICACIAFMSSHSLCGIFSGMKGKSA